LRCWCSGGVLVLSLVSGLGSGWRRVSMS
jgi:hypothetical protein